MSDLIERCIDAYWAPELGVQGLHSTERMSRVFKLVAQEIKEWAPDKSQAKICHLAVNEVADKLLEHAQTNTQSK